MLDINIIHAVQSIGPAWANTAWLLSSIIGSTIWMAPVAIAALLFIGKRRTAVEILFIFVVSAVFLVGVKHLINAPRPYEVDKSVIAYAAESDSGMPSAHAFMSVVILGWLWFRHPKSRVLAIGATLLIFLIGLSRIFLGVHYPSQVLVGWILGLIFLGLFWWADKIYFRPRSSYVSKDKKVKR